MNTSGYSIKDLEVLSGIKAHTIRIWEKRYNLLEPERTDTNIRYYSDEDLRKILNVSMLVRNGYKISKVAGWNDEQVKSTVLQVAEVKVSESDYIDQLIIYMLNFDNRGFVKLTNEIIRELGFEEAVVKVFFNLFMRIGTYWQVGTIFPAQEHFVSQIIRQKLIVEIDRLENNYIKDATVLLYLPENELHELSLLFYYYFAKEIGYNTIYLGQSVPFDDLSKIAGQMEIDYVFTAFINSIPKEEMEDYLERLKQLFVKQKIFITGGQVNNHNPKLPRNIKVVKNYQEFRRFIR
ncbi:MerR family transcriptional regulator [Maribellus comscasis]|uniref:MerR family transcriptional regulator n=1 Tax=Maribellus comscasis TaxID=2681766 RepID=A0A6I6JZZ0_9BACT|nr:MerR family transcriptional regulator [Maribellus comscasis]QGY46748.1 MerR family transcriptional regulator [Maribellus comscasis]